ncbi:YkvA family protein [Nostoc piscinale]|uniref:YkvA family protein n=1 Tax=Nostoc piscinale TaxID=224012 RepID=UPI0039A72FC7
MKFSIDSVYNWYRNLIRNPKYRWWVILGTLVYFISPIDIVPDIFPIVGELDDVLLMTLLVTEVSGLVIDGWKARKGVETTTNPTESSNDVDSSAKTVDVDAVSVK